MRNLPINARGYPIPFFAKRHDKLSVIHEWKRLIAVIDRRCWVCGEKLGRMASFVLGPSEVFTRTTNEPPMHHSCARWAVRGCPFLSNPRRRRTDQDEASDSGVEEHGQHNPGCWAVWTTAEYRGDCVRGHFELIVEDPVEVLWFHRSRLATRDEVERAFAYYRAHFSLSDRMRRFLPGEQQHTTEQAAE
jgi:hypothetical protein